MNPSRIFIERPVATTLLTVAVALAGAAAFMVLPVSPLPQVDFPTITVAASLPGASPDIMASSIATPLERQFGHIAGVTEMTSSSTLGTDRHHAAVRSEPRHQWRRARCRGRHQRGAQLSAGESAGQPDLSQGQSGRLADPGARVCSRTIYDVPTLYDEASTVHCAAHVADRRGRGGAGGGRVAAGGAHRAQSRRSCTATESACRACSRSVSGQNSNLAKGQFANGGVTSDIIANDQISKAADYAPLVVGYHNGAAVRLADVAEVIDSQQTLRQAGFLNGKPSVNMLIFRQPGANIIATVDAVKAAIPSLAGNASRAASTLITMLDRTLTIRASVIRHRAHADDLGAAGRSRWCSCSCATLHATLIPAVAVPVSLIGTCAIMYLCGFSLDNLSLMALAIASGFVVDDAIVVMENITRHLEAGLAADAGRPEGRRRRSASRCCPSASR